MGGEELVVEGPRVSSASASGSHGSFIVNVRFDGDAVPFSLRPTRNCTACCDGTARGDFDASVDGIAWTSASEVALHGQAINFRIELPAQPGFVRYTGGSNFTQCALFNAEGFPALP